MSYIYLSTTIPLNYIKENSRFYLMYQCDFDIIKSSNCLDKLNFSLTSENIHIISNLMIIVENYKWFVEIYNFMQDLLDGISNDFSEIVYRKSDYTFINTFFKLYDAKRIIDDASSV